MSGTDEAIPFHRLLARTFRVHTKAVFGRLAESRITQGQPRILSYLLRHDGCVQRDLAEEEGLEPATVTNALSVMEKAGFVRRESSSEDRRVSRVFITPQGRGALEKAESVFLSVGETCFRGFTPRERKQTMELLGRIYANLKADASEDA